MLALLTLTAAALLHLTILFYGSPDVDKDLREVTMPVRTYSTAYVSKEYADKPPAYKDSSVTELTAGGQRTFTVPTVYVYPSLWERLKAKGAIIKSQFLRIDRRQLLASAGATALVGMVVCGLAFIYLLRYKRISDRLTQRSPAQPGESAEEALSVRVLRVACWTSLASVVAWLAVVLWLIDPAPPPLWLVLPIIVIAAIRITSWVLHVCMPRITGAWTRDMRSLWGAYQATAVYALWAAIVLAAMPLLVYALREYRAWTGMSGIVSLIAARLLTRRTGPDEKKRPVSAALLRWFLAIAIGVGLLLIVVTICAYLVPDTPTADMWRGKAIWLFGASTLLIALGVIGDANRLSPHYFYRDRLAEAYLYTDQLRTGMTSLEVMRDTVELPLQHLHGEQTPGTQPPGAADPPTTAPFHLISCAINLAGSRDLTRKDRKSGYFLFSKYFCGSRHTGYRRTNEYQAGDVKLARAITISGAAASSGIGAGTFFAQSFATVLFNLRLGYWMPNPSKTASTSNRWVDSWRFWPKWLWREVTMGTDERHALINLSDGGHTGDNIGIYPLLQRRCKLIIACDAECDPALAFGSFTEALRHAYIDLGINIDIDLTMLRPDRETGLSRGHCAVGLIRYPPNSQGVRPVGYLVYLKNSLTGDEPEPVLNYKSNNPTFPHESTADQFFDDAQFESYRALGVHIAEHACAQWASSPEFAAWLAVSSAA